MILIVTGVAIAVGGGVALVNFFERYDKEHPEPERGGLTRVLAERPHLNFMPLAIVFGFGLVGVGLLWLILQALL